MEDLGTEVPPNLSIDDSVKPIGNTPGFSGDWKDMAKDIDLLTKTHQVVAPTPVVEIKEPTSTSPAVPVSAEPPKSPPVQPTATVTVPEKFQAADGTLDQERIVKSYLEAEKQLKRLQNKIPQQAITNTQNGVPANLSMPEPNSFEAQVYNDFLSSGLDQRSAAALVPTLTKLFAAASDAGYARAIGEVSVFKQNQEEINMREELKAIVRLDPSLSTPDGIKHLVEIRQANPWLNNSPEPWKAAWAWKTSNESISAAKQQVNTPTPKAVTAPNGSVTAAVAHAEPIVLNDMQAIKTHLATLTDAEKGEFFKRNMGRNTKW